MTASKFARLVTMLFSAGLLLTLAAYAATR
jgi:hypothetical protein